MGIDFEKEEKNFEEDFRDPLRRDFEGSSNQVGTKWIFVFLFTINLIFKIFFF